MCAVNPSHAALSQALVCGLCVLFVVWAVFSGSDETEQPGTLTICKRPVVHRTYAGQPRVPAEVWESLGFVVDDASDEQARTLVAEWGGETLAAYDALPNGAARADLYRYAVVYKRGGWYADADVHPLSAMQDLAATRDLVLFHEACGRFWFNRLKRDLGQSTIMRAPQFKNSAFAAPGGWEPLKIAIEKAVRRARRHEGLYTEADVIEVTGPGVLTDAIQLHGAVNPNRDATIVPCAKQRYFVHDKAGSWRGAATNTAG